MDYLLSFHSTHIALKAERTLKDEGVEFRLLPAPKEITVTCALVIRIDSAILDETLSLLEAKGAKCERVFKLEDKKYVEV
jgi:hypothetical protein